MLLSIDELQACLYAAVKTFFKGATVLWAEAADTRTTVPYVTLKLMVTGRTSHYMDSDYGRYYICDGTLEVNLYTNGKKMGSSYMNTSQTDMMDFAGYMESEMATGQFANKNVTVLLESPIRDLTSLENDRKYRYRAQADFNITFPLMSVGMYGVAGADNYSGRDDSLQEVEIPIITEVEINGGEE